MLPSSDSLPLRLHSNAVHPAPQGMPPQMDAGQMGMYPQMGAAQGMNPQMGMYSQPGMMGGMAPQIRIKLHDGTIHQIVNLHTERNFYKHTSKKRRNLLTMFHLCQIQQGRSATTLYSLVNRKVNITTPVVEFSTWDNLLTQYERPCVFIQIKYTVGLDGTNIPILHLHPDSYRKAMRLFRPGTTHRPFFTPPL